jgi:hypothetical protein
MQYDVSQLPITCAAESRPNARPLVQIFYPSGRRNAVLTKCIGLRNKPSG